MKDKETLKYTEVNKLSSQLNNTKWKKLIKSINSHPDFTPHINYKTIFENENNGKFSLVWWEELEQDGFKIIEWMEIKSYKEEYTGRFTPPIITDYSNFIKNSLDENSIKYTLKNGIFKIIGYYRLS